MASSQKISLRSFVVLSLLFSAAAAMPGTAQAQTESSVVISQVYGGGGNSGATYKNDFIELFNPTPASVSLSGYSVQYASSTGTTWQATSLSGTLLPGHFFLVQEAPGAGGTTNLPTPDAAGTINLSSSTGKVALVNTSTLLVGACPTSSTAVVDFVGFGAANCSLGAPTAALSNTTAAIRTAPCSPTGNNSADFSTNLAPTPRDTSSTAVVCTGAPGSSPPSGTGMASPSSAYAGSPVLLTVQVRPGTNPSSTGLKVTADLSSIGGNSAQPFFDDGSNGDVTANDNTFSFLVSPAATGTFTLPVTIVDSQLRTGSATIALTERTPPAFVSIRTIQSSKPSSYATQTVSTSGIVVGVTSNGFYLEAADADTTPVTPEGILVYSGTAPPASVQVGALVQLAGTVSTYPSTSLTPDTELDSPQSITVLSTNNPLPAPVTITAAMDSPSGGVKQFAPYEGMRVAIASVTTTSGTDATLVESTETLTSTGRFYGVVTGVARPFREPGISITDTTFGPVPAGIPVFDSNPELLFFNSTGFGGPAIDVTSNATLTGVLGVMDFSSGSPTIFIDRTTRPAVSGLMTAVPVPAQTAGQFTVATFNMERFYNDVADADNPGSSVVVVTTAAYQRRLAKASLAIRNVLHAPDVVGVQEIENIAVLTDLANRISSDAMTAGQVDPVYTPYLFLATDGTGINTGMLVKSTRVNTVKAEQLGLGVTFTNSAGAQAVLNDRTPLVAHLGIKGGAGVPDFPVTVISVHQRSLINVDDPTSTGATVRLKREAQAEYLASLIQQYQAAGEHVITVGDYNSFEFSDGFVDVLGVTRGNPVPASQVITPPAAGLANPALVDLVTLLPPAQRQSYVETGSAQVLDHVVVTSDLLGNFAQLVYAHIDSDFPLIDENDPTTPLRISDHDPAVAYFNLPAPAVAGTVQLATTSALSKIATGYQAVFTVKNSGTRTAQNVQLTSASLGSAAGTPVPQTVGDIAPGASATVTVTFPAAGASGSEKYAGSYSGGTFGGSVRASLPQ